MNVSIMFEAAGSTKLSCVVKWNHAKLNGVSKAENGQMDVVTSLWQEGFLSSP